MDRRTDLEGLEPQPGHLQPEARPGACLRPAARCRDGMPCRRRRLLRPQRRRRRGFRRRLAGAARGGPSGAPAVDAAAGDGQLADGRGDDRHRRGGGGRCRQSAVMEAGGLEPGPWHASRPRQDAHPAGRLADRASCARHHGREPAAEHGRGIGSQRDAALRHSRSPCGEPPGAGHALARLGAALAGRARERAGGGIRDRRNRERTSTAIRWRTGWTI